MVKKRNGSRRVEDILHRGEIEAQKRFGAEHAWNEHNLPNMIHETIPTSMSTFIEDLPFFFIATANDAGDCDCSFRGREYNASGQPLPLLKVLDEKRLVFPDFKGNNLFNSLGNMLTNPHIGILFIDFENRLRARVNGAVEIIERWDEMQAVWPTARRYVLVTVEQVYGNCRARIPKMTLVPPSDSLLQEGDF
ncbi:pyridoxamine 5'-phosphate oxidase family protein [Alkalilimnicola ehrlichii]|nr:pyridoxamine 5'-phosphate oxidase family protein [Alkalilimnicola ehrlichii]